jgi:hypothetical protein
MEDKGKIKQIVIKKYSEIITGGSSCCPTNVCCSPGASTESLLEIGRKLGYSDEELKMGLGEANLGLGCWNPNAIVAVFATKANSPKPSKPHGNALRLAIGMIHEGIFSTYSILLLASCVIPTEFTHLSKTL